MDEHCMRLAMAEARAAEAAGEVPVGAIVLSAEGEVIGRGNNQVIRTHDPTAHAEIIAMRAAAQALGNYRLGGCTLVCTLEPCAMCAGAMIHARLETLVYAARDPKAGADGSVLAVLENAALNHRIAVRRGALAEECSEMLSKFFRGRRDIARAERASYLLMEASKNGNQEIGREESGNRKGCGEEVTGEEAGCEEDAVHCEENLPHT